MPSIAQYTVDDIEIGKLTVSTEEDGTINIDGTSGVYGYYIKLTNGLECLKKTGESIITISDWCSSAETIIQKGKSISQEVEVLSGACSGNEVNFCIRSKDKNTIFITKLADMQYNNTFIANTDLSCVYLYISEGATFNNFKIKANFYEKTLEKTNSVIPLIPGTIRYKSLICTINPNNEIIFNTDNKTEANFYIKISNGFEIVETANDINWNISQESFIEKGKKIRLSITDSGAYTGTAFNCILRDTSGTNVINCKIRDKNYSAESTLTNNIPACYIYIKSGATFKNYKIVPTLEILQ